MADKSISELTAATAVGSSDLFVLEQTGTAKKLTGQILENWLVSFADGHGGIQSIAKTGSAGTDPVIDTYTITLADETTFTFTVTNGLKGDTGDQTYVWIKWSASEPTQDSDMGDNPDAWIGIYVGLSSTAPTAYTSYDWYQYKGAKGDTGDPATITNTSVSYQQSNSGTVVPTGSWTTLVPSPVQGMYLWTRVILTFNSGDPITYYGVSHYGLDGSGSVVSVNTVSPDQDGNVSLTASDIPASESITVQDGLDRIATKQDALIYKSVSISAASSEQLIGSITDAGINSNMVVIMSEIANPNYQTSDWTITTYDTAPQLRVVGTASASTTLNLILAEV